MQPSARPKRPYFSSGPCVKRPGWSPSVLSSALIGRSHRSDSGKKRLGQLIELTKKLLQLPTSWRVGIVPASDTGAMEMTLWSLLGARGIDVIAWESFGYSWCKDIIQSLRLSDVRVFSADYGDLPCLEQVSSERDIVFTWNGTTSGVRVPNGDWISAKRDGLTICDATSAVFAMELPWDKLDVVTFSWQKILGGEAQHGMLILSPRAVERLESYAPRWPLPKIFQLTHDGKLIESIFAGETINTPSMLAVEDALDALSWADNIGGLPEMIQRSEANLEAVSSWVSETSWVEFLASVPATRSPTSICLQVAEPWFTYLSSSKRRSIINRITGLLEEESVAYDINSHRDAPPGFRIWGGATVEVNDIRALLPWLNWAYQTVRKEEN